MGVAAADPDATTISVPDPFGVSFVGNPDLTCQTGDASENIAYGYQTIDFDSSNFSSVFTSNVTVDGQLLNLSTNPLIDSGLQANVIDKVDFNGLFNGFAEQQILLRALPAPPPLAMASTKRHRCLAGYAGGYLRCVVDGGRGTPTVRRCQIRPRCLLPGSRPHNDAVRLLVLTRDRTRQTSPVGAHAPTGNCRVSCRDGAS